jgi:DNA-binding response OmpR family regulator
MEGARIVLLDGDNVYRATLSTYLRHNGFDVIDVETLGDFSFRAYNQEWMIFLLNFGTNINHGLEFLKAGIRLRQGPILVLSDSDDPIDRIVCLELGADDCIAKSAHQREILARVRVAARRRPSNVVVSEVIPLPVAERPQTTWHFSREKRELIPPRGQPIDLTSDQFGLLDILIQNTGKALSRDYLSRILFGRALKAGDRSIDNLVVRLRRRLGEPAGVPRLIKTARADGYFFAGFPDSLGMSAPRLLN